MQKDRLRENQMCKPCVNWKFEAVETWGLRFDSTEGNDLLLTFAKLYFRYCVLIL